MLNIRLNNNKQSTTHHKYFLNMLIIHVFTCIIKLYLNAAICEMIIPAQTSSTIST